MISHHSEIRDELSDLASKALVPSAVRDEPRIHTSHAAKRKTDLEEPGNPASRNLHKNQGED